MALQSAYALIDLAFVGRLGESAVAGLSISFQAFFMVLSLSQVVGTTALAGISQAYGRGAFEEAGAQFSAYVLVAGVLGAVTALAAFIGADIYVAAFSDVPEVKALGTSYFKVNSATFLSQMLLIVFGTGLRGSGDFRTPMKFMVLSVLGNLIMDPLLIFGLGPFPELGLAGAAWATVIAQMLSLTLYVQVFLRPSTDPRSLRLSRPRLERRFMHDLLSRGLPSGLQFFLLSVVLGLVLAAVKPHGAVWTAVAGGGFRVIQQAILPMVAVGMACAAIVGQNLGAGRHDRIREVTRLGLTAVSLWAALGGLVLWVAGRHLGALFASSEVELQLSEAYFSLSSPILMAFGWTLMVTNVMLGIGKTTPTLLAAIVKVCVLAVAIWWWLPRVQAPPEWVFSAQVVAQFAEAFLGLAVLWLTLRSQAVGASG